jgi:crotonobetainyl-CoA:carnitine CoA-transferase CaiB-like acyl-CoA transferase
MPEVFADPQVVYSGQVIEVPHPTVGAFKAVGSAIGLGATPTELRRPPPLLGEHTEEILAWLNS